MGSLEDWENLPDKVLVSIFSKLLDIDLVRASCTCKNWRRVYHDPGVWRVRTFDMNRTEYPSLQALETFVDTFGPYFQHLNILTPSFTPNDPTPIKAFQIIDRLLGSLCRLKGDQAGLETFDLADLYFHNLMYDVPEVVCPLIKNLLALLKSQRALRTLKLREAVFDKPFDLLILRSLIHSGSTKTLEVLHVQEYACSACGSKNIHNHMASLFTMCQNLREIGLEHSYLRAKDIMSVWNTLKNTLKKLVIVAGEEDLCFRDNGAITSNWWRETCFKIPELKVDLHCVYMDEDIIEIVVPSMPIVLLTLKGDFSDILGKNYVTGSSKLLDHLVSCCPQTLESVVQLADPEYQPDTPDKDTELLRYNQHYAKFTLSQIFRLCKMNEIESKECIPI